MTRCKVCGSIVPSEIDPVVNDSGEVFCDHNCRWQRDVDRSLGYRGPYPDKTRRKKWRKASTK